MLVDSALDNTTSTYTIHAIEQRKSKSGFVDFNGNAKVDLILHRTQSRILQLARWVPVFW